MNNYVIAALVGVVLIGGFIYISNMTDTKNTAESEAAMKVETERAAMEKKVADDKAMAENAMNEATTGTGVEVGGAMMVPTLDLVDNAVKASNVTTLVAAVKAAGLIDTLKGAGPYTVFAPTNDAFAKLPAGTVDTLLKPDMKADLTSILTYHVVAGRYTAADLKDGMTLKTVNGATLKISTVNGVVKINGAATVETADVISSNGVTHVIDTVLMPPQV